MRQPIVSLVGLVLTVAGCGGAPSSSPAAGGAAPPPAAAAEGVAFAPHVPVQWSEDGATLIVGGAWALDVASGTWRRLALGPGVDLVAAGPAGRVARFADRELRVDGDAPRALDRWVEAEGDVHMTGFFLDADFMYLHQTAPIAGASACRILHLPTGALETPAACVEGDFAAVYHLQPGTGQRLAVHSAGEGHPGVRLVRYDPSVGQAALPAPPLDLYPSGPLEVSFDVEGGTAFLVTPCRLGAGVERPCVDLPDDAPWRVWPLDLESGELGASLAEVPAGAVVDPPGARVAYVRQGKLCVRALAGGDETCHEAPAGTRMEAVR